LVDFVLQTSHVALEVGDFGVLLRDELLVRATDRRERGDGEHEDHAVHGEPPCVIARDAARKRAARL
jgi:hypothetical protein